MTPQKFKEENHIINPVSNDMYINDSPIKYISEISSLENVNFNTIN